MDSFTDYFTIPQMPEEPGAWLEHLGAARADHRTPYRWDGLSRRDGELAIFQYTLDGEGALTDKNVTRRVKKNEAMLLTVPDAHCYFLPESSASWSFCYAVFRGAESMRIFRLLREKSGSIVSLDPNGPGLECFRETVSLRRAGQLNDPYRIAEQTARFLYRLCGELDESTRNPARPEFLKRIFAKTRENPLISIPELVRASGYSKNYFEARFKNLTGKTPHDFLTDLRMEKALSLLENTTMTVKEIAESCGFADAAYFCRAFRKKFGTPPGKFRN